MELLADGGTPLTGGTAPVARRSRKRAWAGRVMSGLAALFLAFDAAAKLLELPQVIEGSVRLGYPAHAVFGIGVIQSACVAAYVVPRTAVLGAVLLTAHLGGAVASHLRVGDPILSHTLFPVYLAVLVWGGLHLRDDRLGAIVPWRGRA